MSEKFSQLSQIRTDSAHIFRFRMTVANGANPIATRTQPIIGVARRALFSQSNARFKSGETGSQALTVYVLQTKHSCTKKITNQL